MPTVVDLGRAKKQQRPGVYDDVDDAALGLAVQKKFPRQYDDFLPTGPMAPIPGALKSDKQDHSLEDAAWNFGWPNLVSGVSQTLKPGQRLAGLHKTFTGATQIGAVPALVTAPLAVSAAGLAGGTLGGAVGKYGSEFLGASPEVSDLVGDAGSVIGGAAGGLAGESPRLRGYVSGTAKAPLQALKVAGSVKSGNIHGLGSSLAAIGNAPAEGAKGKLWLGDIGRGVRDFFTTPKIEEISGTPSTPGLSNIPVSGRILTPDEVAFQSAPKSKKNIAPPAGFGKLPIKPIVPEVFSGKPSTPGLSNIPTAGRALTPDELAFEASPKYLKPNAVPVEEAPSRFYELPGTKPVAQAPVLPDLRSSYQPLSNMNAAIDPIDTNALLAGTPLRGGPLLPDVVKMEPPEVINARIAAQASAPKSAIPTQATLDAAAKRVGFKSYAETPDTGKAFVMQAAKAWEETTGPVAAPKATPSTKTATTYMPDLESKVIAPPIEPLASGAPMQPIGNNINYPGHIHEQLHAAGPDVAITHASNASAKDLAVATRLKAAGITPKAMDAMSDTDLNQHYTALKYKPLGSDYAPGKRVGRPADVGRAHLRNVLEGLWK